MSDFTNRVLDKKALKSWHRRFQCGVLLTAFLAAPPSLAATGTSQYVYDDLGRLIQVIASDGSNVQYAYDAAGNLAGIKNNAVNAVSIAGFTPNIGSAGTTVTLQGSGFSLTPSANTVLFNGQAAVVSAATASTLTVSVPSGASTGIISVSNSSGSANSLSSFTVGSIPAAPAISSFSPTIANPGGTVTIAGTGFQASPASNNKVLVGTEKASVTTASSTSVAFTVPLSSGGLLNVATPYGQVTSSSSLFVVPTGVAPASVVESQVFNLDGTPVSMNIAAGKFGVYSFDGAIGQQLGLAISGYSSSPGGGNISSLNVYTPQGVLLASCGSYSSTSGCPALNGKPLPSTGRYSVVVQADGSHASTATLTLSTQPSGTIVVGGSAVAVTASRVGQAPRYTFTGNAGDTLSLSWTGSTFPSPTYLYVYAPDNTAVASTQSVDSAATNVLSNLAQTGTYTVMLWPAGNAGSTGSVSLQLKSAANGTLIVDGTPTAVSLGVGQQGNYTFSGTAGQQLGLALSGYSSTPAGGSVSLNVYTPQGVLLASCGAYASTNGCAALNGKALPSTGTYRVEAQADGSHASTATLTLSTQPSGSITVGGSAVAVTASRLGQAPRYTFTGTAGGTLSLSWTGSTFPSPTYLYVYAPDNTAIASTLSVDAAASTVLGNLPQTGTYTVMVWPAGNAGSTGSVSLQLKSAATGTLAVNGTATAISLAAGQQGNYTFSGTAGQQLGLALSGYGSTPSGGSVSMNVYTPQGVLLASCGSYSGTSGCPALNGKALPSTGTYRVEVQADGSHASTATLTLSTQPSGSITVGGSAVAVTASRLGQAPRYTFSGTAGGTLSLSWTGSTFPSPTYLYVYAPDNTAIASTLSVDSAGATVFSGLAQTGTYTVMVWPAGNAGSTGSVSLQLKSAATGTLAVNGTATAISLAAGQQGNYTFSGTAGQQLGLALSGYGSTPSGGSVSMNVYTPQGVLLASCGSYSSTSGCSALNGKALPSTGTYRVEVVADGSHASTATLTLSTQPTGTITVGGSAVAVTASRLGQAPRYTFTGTAGDTLSLSWASSTFPTPTYLYVYAPDNTLIASNVSVDTAGSRTLSDLTLTGTYTVMLWPSGSAGSTGSINLQLAYVSSVTPPSYTATGALAIDGTPTAISLSAGQTGIYTFSGTANQQLGLALSGYSSTPAGGSVNMKVYTPQGTLLADCGNYSGTSGCYGLNGGLKRLPSTGTYRVEVQADGSHASNATLTLSTHPADALVIGGGPSTKTLSRPGQVGRFTFSGTAGQALTVLWSNATYPGTGYLSVLNPDRSVVSSVYADAGTPTGAVIIDKLSVTGTYTIEIWPAGNASTTGAITLELKSSTSGTLTVDGTPTAISLSAGQKGNYTFSGTANQQLGLALSGYSSTPSGGSVSMKVYTPQGTLLADCGNYSGTSGCYGLNGGLKRLPSTGSYRVEVQADGSHASNATLTLSTHPADALVIDGGPSTKTLSRPGQVGRFTFSGTAGQALTVLWSNATYPGTGYLSVLNPDRSVVSSVYADAGSPTGAVIIDKLSVTGTYTIEIWPAGNASTTGAITLELKGSTSGTLTVDGTPTAISLSTGQKGIYTFSGTANQQLGLALSGYSSTPSGGSVSMKVYTPEGALLADCGSYSSTAGCLGLNGYLKLLPSTGTYRVELQADGSHASAATLTLSTHPTDALVIDGGPSTKTLSRPGQVGRYTFNGTAGQALSLLWSNATYPGTGYFSVWNPDRSTRVVNSVYADAGTPTGAAIVSSLPVTGTYTVEIWPPTNASTTGAITLDIKGPSTGTLATDGSVSNISLSKAQQGFYTFEGVAGQRLKLQMTEVATAPTTAATVSFSVTTPNGVVFATCSSTNTSSLWQSCKMPVLPKTGTYVVAFNAGNNSATLKLTVAPMVFME